MFTNVLLQGAAAPGGGSAGLFIMIGMIVVMYFFMIRPQQKKAKEQRAFADSLGTGEKIVTTSGIHGRITRTNDDGTLALEIDRNTTITVERQAVSMEMTQAYNKRTNNSTTVATTEKA
ncbi:MAG TPA: preprotein translocase subunit YajC [Edaphocola sp.]|nr:preprotein translocase subunit YajC [Edaphocola sp.]